MGTFPEAIVVDVPDYTGEQFYQEEPTWVPILSMTAFKAGTNHTREQFPLVAAYAITINKAQGLTIKEGVVINLAGSARFRPAATHRLPFVAFTRSESFAMTAFYRLPPWDDFDYYKHAPKRNNMLDMRWEYEDMLKEMHVRTLAMHSDMKNAKMEAEAHERWRLAQAKRGKSEGPLMPCPACNVYTAACRG